MPRIYKSKVVTEGSVKSVALWKDLLRAIVRGSFRSLTLRKAYGRWWLRFSELQDWETPPDES